jgi:hypothetical protein
MALKLTFAPAKVTPNTVKFAEEIKDEMLAVAKVGSLYVPKRTLADMGWNGENLTVTIA